MSEAAARPILIRRKKIVVAGGHHGGAWKVAYADFVTAMMAFFMLMWLLNATTETQRKGLADYFSPTIAVARVSGGGDGAFSGDSVQTEKNLSQSGTGGFMEMPPSRFEEQGQIGTSSGEQSLEELAEAVQSGLAGRGGESLIVEMALEHIITKVTDEGVVIEILDFERDPLFEPGTNIPTPVMAEIASILNDTLSFVENGIAVSGFSVAFPKVLITDPAWDISLARAQATRSLLRDTGFPAARIKRIVGHGDRRPRLQDPMAYENNRLEIVLLRESGDLRK